MRQKTSDKIYCEIINISILSTVSFATIFLDEIRETENFRTERKQKRLPQPLALNIRMLSSREGSWYPLSKHNASYSSIWG